MKIYLEMFFQYLKNKILTFTSDIFTCRDILEHNQYLFNVELTKCSIDNSVKLFLSSKIDYIKLAANICAYGDSAENGCTKEQLKIDKEYGKILKNYWKCIDLYSKDFDAKKACILLEAFLIFYKDELDKVDGGLPIAL